MLPKISIITPSYNQAQFLEDTILSVLGQGYPNLEYLIMDGGSNDGSKEIIKKYSDSISYWQSIKDKGQADAINQGFKKAGGEILMWLNSDDMLMPNVLYKIADYYKKEPEHLYFGNCIHFQTIDSGVKTVGSNVLTLFNENRLNELDFIIQPSSFWNRKIWEETGPLDETYHFGFDWEWFLRVQKNFKLTPISDVLSMYRIHDQHKSGTGGKQRQKELLKIYQKFNPRFAILYSLLMKEDFETIRQRTNLKFKTKSVLKKPTSFYQKLRVFGQGNYDDFSNKEIHTAIGML